MATTTSNLGLTKPDYTDAADVGVLNGNFDLLDQAIAEDRKQIVRSGNVRNLLDNSDFMNPVNQRGQDSYNVNGYCFDRWEFENMNENSGSTGITDGGIWLSCGVEDGYVSLVQRIPLAKVLDMNGKVCTFCYQDFDTLKIHCAKLVLGYEIGGVECNRLTIYSTTFTDEYASLYIRAKGLNENGIKWAALYEGEYTEETLPPYVPKGYAAELAECQRYFQRIKLSNGYLSCANFSTTSARTVLFTPEMRTKPTITAENWFTLLDLSSAKYCEVTSVQIVYMSANAYMVSFSSSGLTNNGISAIYPTDRNNVLNVDLSADL